MPSCQTAYCAFHRFSISLGPPFETTAPKNGFCGCVSSAAGFFLENESETSVLHTENDFDRARLFGISRTFEKSNNPWFKTEKTLPCGKFISVLRHSPLYCSSIQPRRLLQENRKTRPRTDGKNRGSRGCIFARRPILSECQSCRISYKPCTRRS